MACRRTGSVPYWYLGGVEDLVEVNEGVNFSGPSTLSQLAISGAWSTERSSRKRIYCHVEGWLRGTIGRA